MEQFITSEFKLGIIAGGQLGKMLALAASNWDIHVSILDSSENCPAASVCHRLIQGNLLSYDDILAFGQEVDMIALEIENVNVEALKELKAQGKAVFPDPDILEIIQDKGLQKLFYRNNGIPTSPFSLFEDKREILQAVEENRLTLPFVQKTRKAGYDGKGVKLVKTTADLDDLLDGAAVVEDLTGIKKELAVIVAQNTKNEIRCFPVVEMVFNEDANLVEQLICPASIPSEVEKKAMDLAVNVIKELDLKGILAVEMFLTHQNELIINEVAPRPHNSGHHTIESAITSQYEQYLRAIFGFPLGDTSVKLPSVMMNLLGEPDCSGKVRYEGVEESMMIDGVKIHIYGKKKVTPFRKMGHVTIMDKDINRAIEKAKEVKTQLKVTSWKNQK